MYTYCVTFRIANLTVGGQSYGERRQRLVDNVRSDNAGFWDEPTSFILTESNLDTNAFAKRASQGLSEKHDLVFVFDPSDMSACYFGAIEARDVLLSFFPKAKKVP